MKVGRIPFSGQAAVELLKASDAAFVRVVENGLPRDARFVRAALDEHGYVWLIVESESFAEVQEPEPIPLLKAATFEKVCRP